MCPFIPGDFSSVNAEQRPASGGATMYGYLDLFWDMEEIDKWADIIQKRAQGPDLMESVMWACRCVVASKQGWRTKGTNGRDAFEQQVVIHPRKQIKWFPRDHEVSRVTV
jgi:hypothetical protein